MAIFAYVWTQWREQLRHHIMVSFIYILEIWLVSYIIIIIGIMFGKLVKFLAPSLSQSWCFNNKRVWQTCELIWYLEMVWVEFNWPLWPLQILILYIKRNWINFIVSTMTKYFDLHYWSLIHIRHCLTSISFIILPPTEQKRIQWNFKC